MRASEFGYLGGLLLCGWLACDAGAQTPAASADQPIPSIQTNERPANPGFRPALGATLKPSLPAYVLGPNDLVLVEVFQEPDLTVQRRISENGTVDLPLLGRLTLGGKTIEQATTLVHTALEQDYLVNPRVNLTVLDHAKWKFTVLGQVFKPGPFEVSAKEKITLVDAIAMAGGPTPKGNLKRVTLSRPAGGGRNDIIELNADEMIKKGDSQSFEILSGDTITVAERAF